MGISGLVRVSRAMSTAGAALLTMSACVLARPPVVYETPAAVARSARLILTDGAIWATHAASGTLTKLRIPDGSVAWRATLGCEPATVAQSLARVAVSCPQTGQIVLLDDAGRIVGRRMVGRGVFGVLFAGRLYATLAYEAAIVALDPTTLAEIGRAPTGALPRGIAIKGDVLYVVHGGDASLRLYDPRDLSAIGTIEVGQQAGVAESVTAHPVLPRIYVPHTRLNVTNLARQFDTTVFPVVAAIDTSSRATVRREALSLDSVDTPVGMPLAVAVDAGRGRLYSVNAASDDLSVVDLRLGIGVGHVEVGQRPRDVVLSPDGTRLFTLDQLAGTITEVDTDRLAVVRSLQIADDPRPPQVRLGERLFTTSRLTSIARDRWVSCSTCHIDAGHDGATWMGSSDGPRNTPTLRGLAGTAPFHWSANRPDIRSFQATITGFMGGSGLRDDELDAIEAFLFSLDPIPSPRRELGGGLTLEGRRGAKIFADAGCAACHVPPLFTDRRTHDVGTGRSSGATPERAGSEFKTPALRELWLTDPYLHDGRAASIPEAIAAHTTTRLSPAQLRDLEAFLLQLPLSNEERTSLFGR